MRAHGAQHRPLVPRKIQQVSFGDGEGETVGRRREGPRDQWAIAPVW